MRASAAYRGELAAPRVALAPPGHVPVAPRPDAGAPRRRRPRRAAPPAAAAAAAGAAESAPGIFPAGRLQERVRLPALMLLVGADEVAASPAAAEAAGAAVAGGATAVVLREAPGAGGGGAGALYAAAVALRAALRGRVPLLVEDRLDVADAAGADGALLSPGGLPTVVARGQLAGGGALVGRAVDSAADAVAAAAEGAGFVLLRGGVDAAAVAAAARQKGGGRVPVVVAIGAGGAPAAALPALLAAGADGAAVPLGELAAAAAAVTGGAPGAPADAAAALLRLMAAAAGANAEAAAPAAAAPSAPAAAPAAAPPAALRDAAREELIAAEREALGRLLGFLRAACPALAEAELLADALRALGEPLLAVVVGEFNSGKSAVVNALLGRRWLEEGILPTTNEVCVLRWAGDAAAAAAAAPGGAPLDTAPRQAADGLFARALPAPLLRDVTLVDTPGTNVILERQQRLTEEYVPRADLVLFVMSADRPCTDSEVKFLKYIRRWGKKVVFVVNKIDLLADDGEVGEVAAFVSDNAARLLGVEGARVLPLSARLGAAAKRAARRAGADSESEGAAAGDGALTAEERAALGADPRWAASRFGALEDFVAAFLAGGAGAGGAGEGARLKLQTPLAVADALLGAARAQLAAEAGVAAADAASVRLVRAQLADFRAEMEREGGVQRDEVGRQVAAVAARAGVAVDATLQLANWPTLRAYLLGPGGGAAMPVAAAFQREAAADGAGGLRAALREHSAWAGANCGAQVENYRAFAAERAAALARAGAAQPDDAPGLADASERARWRAARAALAAAAAAGPPAAAAAAPGAAAATEALDAARALDPAATEAFLEAEVRDVVLGTAGTVAGAGAFGLVLTSVLPTALEDLLALGLAAAAGYASVLNLPLRRAAAKNKVDAAAAELSARLQAAMEAELAAALEACEAAVLAAVEPLEAATTAEAARAAAVAAQADALAGEVAALQRRVAGVE
jgi:GTP-binding protein EngB required for normal cell division